MEILEPSQKTFWTAMELDKLTSSLGGSPVNSSAARLEEEITPPTSGRKWRVWSLRSGRDLSSRKTLSDGSLSDQRNSSVGWGCSVTSCVYQRMLSGQTITEIAGGPLHTPTKTANFRAPSMQKHASCQRYGVIFGARKITEPQFAFLMGFPPDW